MSLFRIRPQPPSQILLFQEQSVKVLRRPFQRRLRLSVRPCGQVQVTANRTLSEEKILQFLQENQNWLEKAQRQFLQLRERYPAKQFKEGESFLFLGRPRALRLVTSSQRQKVNFTWPSQRGPGAEEFWALAPESLLQLSCPQQRRAEFQPALLKFYQGQGRELLTQRVSHYSERMKLWPQALRFASQKTRWGSCSAKGQISLNWRLVAAPPDVLDYVVVHELAHLRHPNHSSAFWALVQEFVPDWRDYRHWLRQHHYEFDFLARRSELHSL